MSDAPRTEAMLNSPFNSAWDAHQSAKALCADLERELAAATAVAEKTLIRVKVLEGALAEIREQYIEDVDASMEPGDDRFRGNKASDTILIIDAVL